MLLGAAGVAIRMEATARARVPAVMLGPASQSLLADVFARPDLLPGLWPIRRRVVAWGSAAPVDLPHRALVVSEQELLARLQAMIALENADTAVEADWTLHCSRPADGAPLRGFGTRLAAATQVKLSPLADAQACLVESVPGGWLFLLPVDGETAWLLSAGEPAETLLGQSRLVAPSIAKLLAAGGTFPAYPRIAESLCGERWLACGSAALGFDPLCGDGTGHALREAILACAVIQAAERGIAPDDLQQEYRLRLWAGFGRHLEHCQQFYATGGTSDWWRSEGEHLRQGRDWIAARNSPGQLGRFRLNGFALERAG